MIMVGVWVPPNTKLGSGVLPSLWSKEASALHSMAASKFLGKKIIEDNQLDCFFFVGVSAEIDSYVAEKVPQEYEKLICFGVHPNFITKSSAISAPISPLVKSLREKTPSWDILLREKFSEADKKGTTLWTYATDPSWVGVWTDLGFKLGTVVKLSRMAFPRFFLRNFPCYSCD